MPIGLVRRAGPSRSSKAVARHHGGSPGTGIQRRGRRRGWGVDKVRRLRGTTVQAHGIEGVVMREATALGAEGLDLGESTYSGFTLVLLLFVKESV